MMFLFWEVVGILEIFCNLWVVVVILDGVFLNRRFYCLYKEFDGGVGGDLCYCIVNFYVLYCFIYFFLDVLYFVKIIWNCLKSLGFGICIRYMWNDGNYILWQYIIEMFFQDFDNGLKFLLRLIYDYINLNVYFVMWVNFVVQVLSVFVVLVLKIFGLLVVVGIVRFCEMVDQFFDCFNV